MVGYLFVEGIKGESQDAGHKDWINLVSVEQTIHRPMEPGASGATRHRGTAYFEGILIAKEVDASTPKLAESIADGKNFPMVKIHLVTSSEAGKRIPYLMWELKNARLTSYHIRAVDEHQPPTEQLSLNFEEIKQIYDKLDKQNKSAGKIEYTWKVEEGIA